MGLWKVNVTSGVLKGFTDGDRHGDVDIDISGHIYVEASTMTEAYALAESLLRRDADGCPLLTMDTGEALEFYAKGATLMDGGDSA